MDQVKTTGTDAEVEALSKKLAEIEAEVRNEPQSDRAPIKFLDEAGTFYFQHSNGSSIPGANLPISVINNNEDMFVIEVYRDDDARNVMLCYGFGWKGTYAAGKYFHSIIHPNIASYNVGWVIVKWQDTNGDSYVNIPGDGDTYTLIEVLGSSRARV